MANKNTTFEMALKEAHRVLDANPSLKCYEAMIEAKSIVKEKELSDGNLKSSKVKKNN